MRILERLEIQTSSSFVKIFEFKANSFILFGVYIAWFLTARRRGSKKTFVTVTEGSCRRAAQLIAAHAIATSFLFKNKFDHVSKSV
jgi:hypothetical protein